MARRDESAAVTMRSRDACSSSLRSASSASDSCSAESSRTLCSASPSWRASSTRARSSSSLNAARVGHPAHHHAARAVRRGGRSGRPGGRPSGIRREQLGQPDRRPARAADAGPADDDALVLAELHPVRRPGRHAHRAGERAVGAGPDLGPAAGHGRVQRLGQLQQQFVHRHGAAHPRPEPGDHLVRPTAPGRPPPPRPRGPGGAAPGRRAARPRPPPPGWPSARCARARAARR